MESRHSVQSTSVSYGGIGEIQKDVPNSRYNDVTIQIVDSSLYTVFKEYIKKGIIYVTLHIGY